MYTGHFVLVPYRYINNINTFNRCNLDIIGYYSSTRVREEGEEGGDMIAGGSSLQILSREWLRRVEL